MIKWSDGVLNKYEVVSSEYLEDIGCEGWLLAHRKTGARVALLPSEDDNKVFYIGFRTPPTNSKGMAHIVEHTVLCGSRDFPVKDPFIELAKGSLNTFLNAMTYPDKTVYPVASCNDADFRNLMHVYLDAVFYPNIYREENIFRQEGWHYEMEDVDGPITINGVVYNEMKGALSSPDDVLGRSIYGALYPHTPYAVESGGDPVYIPELSYEEYLDFHRRYYHPSNSYIYMYGNMDMEERLLYMDQAYLSAFDRLEIDSEIAQEPAFTAPVEKVEHYSVLQKEDEARKSYLSFNLSLAENGLDGALNLAFKVLDYVLCDAEGAPIKKALRDKGIGEDVYSMLELGIRQPGYTIVSKYTDPERKQEFVDTILGTFEKIVREGLDDRALLAGINHFEFNYREANFGTYPKGLVYGLGALDTWLYDDKAPFINLKVGPVFEELRSKIGKGYFEQLIKKYMLDNRHRAIVVMTPETGLTEKMTARLREKLDALAASLTKEERQKIIDDLAGLRQWQEKEESEEDRAKIPMLSRDELDRKARPYVNVVEKVDGTEGVTLVSHPLATGGIDYLTFMFDISQLPARFFPYLGIFKTLLGVLDTENYSYAGLDQEINIMTGGVGSTVGIYTIEGEPGRYRMMMEITSKALHGNMKSVFDLVQEIAMRTKWNSPARILEVLEEERAGMQAELPAAGHATALVRAKSYFSEPSLIMDSFSGITGFHTLDRICSVLEKTRTANAAAGGEDKNGAESADGAAVAESAASAAGAAESTVGAASAAGAAESAVGAAGAAESAVSVAGAAGAAGGEDASGALNVAQEPEEIMETLAEMAGYVFRADRLMVDCTAEQADLPAVKEEIAVFCQGLHPSQTAEQDLAQYGERFAIRPVRKNEGFTTAGQVQYVCRAGRFDRNGLAYTGAMRVLRVILGYEYLWYKVRMTGGAYGCMSGFSRDGSAFFVSYRDPHLGQTLETFEDAPSYIREYEADERAMTKAIIGAVSVLDHPLTPPVYGKYSLTGYMTGVSIDKIQKERDELLSCTVEDIRALADQLDAFLDDNCLCVVGSDEKLRSQEERFDVIRQLI